jgi:putative DNA primase/helicase
VSTVLGPATNGPVKLSDFYNEKILPRLTPELVYDWPGHNWHRSREKWRGACPHHTSESGTSFNISLDTLTWFCPACDIGGGPVQYLHWLQGGTGSPKGREFVDVLRVLAERTGLALPERELTDEERAAAEIAAAKRGALEVVYRICQDHLWSDAGESARAYLHSRGIGDDASHALELGLYPALREIREALAGAGYQPSIDTATWQRLVGYVTFPWRDDYGQPLTLYGRWPGSKGWPDGCEKTMALPGEGSKGSPLYFDRLRRAHLTDAVLVEGLLDAAVGQANGLTNIVAYVGAQPSYAQHAVLARHRIKTATICSDPDKGGEGGTLSFLRNADPSIRTYVAPTLPDGQDPDEFILKNGVDGWQRHIGLAEPGHAWRARHILAQHDLVTAKGRDDARVDLVEYARTVQEHEQDAIAVVAAEPLQLDAGTLRRYLGSEGDPRNGHSEQSVPTPLRAVPQSCRPRYAASSWRGQAPCPAPPTSSGSHW